MSCCVQGWATSSGQLLHRESTLASRTGAMPSTLMKSVIRPQVVRPNSWWSRREVRPRICRRTSTSYRVYSSLCRSSRALVAAVLRRPLIDVMNWINRSTVNCTSDVRRGSPYNRHPPPPLSHRLVARLGLMINNN